MICIAGMPRSGTSLVTQLLHRSGLHLGRPEDLLAASVDNADGYWENLKFVRLNERLLAANGGTWFAPPSTLRPTPEITAAAKSLVAEFEGREPWGWKDPRTAVTLPFWKGLLSPMKVLICVRHPEETASSLAVGEMVPRTWPFYWSVTRPDSPITLRQGPARLRERVWGAARASFSSEKRRTLIGEVGLELWRVYNTRVIEETSAANRLVTHYEAMLTRPRAELERILDFAGMRVSSDVLDAVTGVVTPRLRHHRASTAVMDGELAERYAELLREASSTP